MDFFIQKLCSGKTDELAHLQFERYSRGLFKDKAIVQCKFSKGNYTIATTNEYANEFVLYLADKLRDSKTQVSGVIVSTRNLKDVPEFNHILAHAKVKQFAGVKQFIIDMEISGNELMSMVKQFPRAFFGLSLSIQGYELKTKAKAPKSAKPGNNSEKGPKVDFCKMKTNDKELIKKMIFEVNTDNFKELIASHDFIIEDIEIPSDEKDPVKMRENAIRKGKIIRKLKIDGVESKKEFSFLA